MSVTGVGSRHASRGLRGRGLGCGSHLVSEQRGKRRSGKGWLPVLQEDGRAVWVAARLFWFAISHFEERKWEREEKTFSGGIYSEWECPNRPV